MEQEEVGGKGRKGGNAEITKRVLTQEFENLWV